MILRDSQGGGGVIVCTELRCLIFEQRLTPAPSFNLFDDSRYTSHFQLYTVLCLHTLYIYIIIQSQHYVSKTDLEAKLFSVIN